MHRTQPLFFFLMLFSSFTAFTSEIVPFKEPLTTDNPYNDPWECNIVKDEWRCFEKLSLRPSLYNKPSLLTDQKQEALIYALGWMPTNSDSKFHSNICEGRYYQPSYMNYETSGSLNQSTSKVDYSSLQYELGGTARLTGHVEIRQPGRRLHTDEAIIYPGQGENKIRRIEARGHLRLSQPGILLLGNQGEADLDSHHAKVDDITYLVQVKSDWQDNLAGDINFSGFARGQAAHLEQHNKNLFSLTDASYTTCPPTSSAWTLHAKEIVLDKQKGRGYATHTILDVQNIPVFYLPYFSFPINQERQSGFLYGDAGLTSDGGVFLSLPYYFNLAPNYDWTLTPNLYSTRGVLVDNELRYLTYTSRGEISVGYIEKDQIYNNNRGQFSFKNHSLLKTHWTIDTEYHFISDTDYLKDFNENSTAATANTLMLPREFKAKYQDESLLASLFVQNYQVVNETLSLTNRPYKKMPAVSVAWTKEQIFSSPLHFNIQTESIHFQKSPLQGETPINSYRSHLDTSVSLPWHQSYGYLNPEVRLLGTHYDLEHSSTNALNRSLYQLSLDSGLHFEHTLHFGQHAYQANLDPRLFYLYTPYRSQSNIPVFNTGILAFNYDGLFAKNRFTDIDRIGDTNQIALGLTTAIHNQKSNNVMNIQLGQLIYFSDRSVSLCNTPGCQLNEDPHYLQKSSDIIAHLDTYLTPQIKGIIEMNYNPYSKVLDAQHYELEYHDLADHHIFNVSYLSNRYAYNQLTQEQLLNGVQAPLLEELVTSTSWKILPDWKLVAAWNFSLNASRTIDLFSGLEYSSCCWSVRFLVHRYLVATNPNNPSALEGTLTTVPMISFVLKGLGGTDNSKLSRLEQQIPGVSEIKH